MVAKTEIDINLFLGPPDTSTLQNVIAALCPLEPAEGAARPPSLLARFAVLESLTDTRFPLPKKGEITLEEWPKGRLFAAAFELQWEKLEQGFRSCFACEKSWTWPEPANGVDFKTALNPANRLLETYAADPERERYSVYLRPEQDNSLGRLLQYEALAATRPKSIKNESPNALLEIKRYFDGHGRLLFWRYQNMRWE